MRNEDRLRAAKVAEVSALVNKQTESANPIEIPTQYQIVDLPSKGEFYPDGHPWKDKESVEMRFMTAKEEDILTNKSFIQKGVVLDKLLKAIIVDKVDLDSVLLCDKSALIVAARISGYGSEYKVDFACPACNKRSKFVFDLDLFANVYLDEETLEFEHVQRTVNGTFVVELPRTKVLAEFRLLTGTDEKKLSSLTENKKNNNLPETGVTDQLKQYVLSIDGNSDRLFVTKFIDNTLPAFDSRFLRAIYKEISPRVSNKQEFTCQFESCGETQAVEVPLTVEFFWPE